MKVLKVVLAFLSLAFFGAALGMFGLYFIDTKTVVGSFTNISHFTNGFKLAFQAKDLGLEANDGLGTLFAFIFVVLGILAACYGLFVALTAKKSKKGNKNAKLICACCTFVVCGVVPAVLLFLTLQTSGCAGSIGGKSLGASTQLGIGAILSAVFSLLGACSLSVAEIK